jgi:hypothetical protein
MEKGLLRCTFLLLLEMQDVFERLCFLELQIQMLEHEKEKLLFSLRLNINSWSQFENYSLMELLLRLEV